MHISYRQSLLAEKPQAANGESGWAARHHQALTGYSGNPHTRAMSLLLRGWAEYADAHRQRYETNVGRDGVLGVPWALIGRALRDLLNGETGDLDCGTLDGFILNTLAAEGFKDE